MKIRNVKTSLLVLIGLIVLSLAFYVSAEENFLSNNNIFLDSDRDGLSDKEEKSLGTDPGKSDTDNDGYSDKVEINTGYNPLQPAPGDKLINETEKQNISLPAISANEKNLTQFLSQKIVELSNEKSGQGETISQNEVQALVDESLLVSAQQEIQLPEIKKEDLKIKKQDYAKYSEEKAQAKRQEDFSNYIVAVFYILSINSPQPITSDTLLSNVFDSLTQEIIRAITLRDTASLEKLNANWEKIRQQLMEVEVPEELADTHIKILQFAQYSREAEKLINPAVEDPVADIANLSRLAGLVTSLMSFTSEVQAKFSEYHIESDKNLQKKIESLGVELPQDMKEELEKSQEQAKE